VLKGLRIHDLHGSGCDSPVLRQYAPRPETATAAPAAPAEALFVSAMASELPLAADDESGALNLLQHKAGAQERTNMGLVTCLNHQRWGLYNHV